VGVQATEPDLRDGRQSDGAQLRVYLAGAIALQAGDRLLHDRQLPGPLGRHALAFLAAEHTRAIAHDEIAEEIWRGTPPPAWASSLKALLSRTRSALAAAGFDGGRILVGAPGVYRFILPADGWLDLDAAKSAAHASEAMLSNGDLDRAAREVFVAKLITERPFMPGITGPWLDNRREQFRDLRIRALECSARIELAKGSFTDAVRDASSAVNVAPLREASWWLLMDAHAAAGDLASAIDAYERCRSTLSGSLGITPSAATRDRHTALLAQTSDA
jgi:DNA-binding SARP family transcriptional activator